MSAESANQSANQSANKSKKRPFSTISNRKPQVFTFSNRHIGNSLLRHGIEEVHNFSARSNANIKKYYGSIETPKGGKRSGKRSGQKTRRHRTRRHH
jgi:hypothetical protein